MLKFSLLSFVGCSSPAAAAQNPHLVVYQGDKGPGHGKHIVFSPAITSIAPRSRCRRWRGSSRSTTGSSAASSSPSTRDRLHRTRQLEDRRARGARRRRTCSSSSCASRISPTTRCSTSSTTWIAAGRSSAFRTATHAFQIKRPDAKFLKFDWQNKDESTGRVRPADPRRNVGLALRHESQAELAAAPRAVAGGPSGPARREGRVGAVGRLHRRIRSRRA